jgi:hypothetical protein
MCGLWRPRLPFTYPRCRNIEPNFRAYNDQFLAISFPRVKNSTRTLARELSLLQFSDWRILVSVPLSVKLRLEPEMLFLELNRLGEPGLNQALLPGRQLVVKLI